MLHQEEKFELGRCVDYLYTTKLLKEISPKLAHEDIIVLANLLLDNARRDWSGVRASIMCRSDEGVKVQVRALSVGLFATTILCRVGGN